MGEVMNGVETPTSHLVVLEFQVVDLVGVAVCDQVVQPVEENGKPGCPKRITLPQMGLKLYYN